MADNVNILDAAAATVPVAADVIGGVAYQRFKLTMGAADAVDMDLDSGQQTMVNSLPVALASDQSAIPVTVATIPSHAVTNAGTFATQATIAAGATSIAKAEDVASVDADVGVPSMAIRKATPANTSGTDGDYEMLQMSAGRLWVDPSGVTLTVGSHAVTNAGTFATQATIAAGATSIAKAEDVASVDADVGVPAMAVRKASPANTSGTDGDYEMLQMSAGRLWVDPSGVTLTVGSHAVTNAGTFAVQAADAGDVAHDGVDTGNPIKVGFQARTTDITAVSSADRVNAIGDTLGKQVVLLGSVHDLHVDGKANYTNTVAADVIAAVASTRIVVTSILVINAHATVATVVEIRDATTVKLQGYAAAAGGGFNISAGGAPLFIGTSGAAITARNVTTGSNVDVFISGYKIAN